MCVASIEKPPAPLESTEAGVRGEFTFPVLLKIPLAVPAPAYVSAILVTDHNVKNLFDITDRSYVLGEHTVIAEGTSRELLKSTKAIEHYFGSQFS